MNVLDLFCGCGGLTQGFSEAGLNVVAGIDNWQIAIDTYARNHKHLALCADLTTLPPESLDLPRIDIVIGGPPCQGFSTAGKRIAADPRNSLFMHFLRFVNYFQPKFTVMENVPGILTAKNEAGQPVIDIIIAEYRKIGYDVEYKVLMASDYGVPQNRKRVIFLGRRIGAQAPAFPQTTHTSARVPVSTVLLDRAQVPASAYLSERALAGIERKKENMKKKNHGFGAQYLNFDKPSYTIPARYWKDGYDALVRYDEKHVRRLLIPELAAIQSFPADYIFCGSKKEVIMQLGNAVPCKLAYHIAKSLMNTK